VLFNCSQQMLAAIPDQVWDNVTVLDISQNQLNLIHPKTLWELRRFRQLVKLNLSGNYLPLLEKDTLGIHPLLQVLDLSRCQLAGIEVGALQAFPKLQALFLGNNQLQDPLPVALKEPNTLAFLDLFGNSRLKTNPPYWLKIKSVLWPAESDGRESRDISQETDVNRNQSSKTWPYLVAVLVTAIFTSISIALAAKCKLLHRYLASYRHTLLREGDTCSQGVPAGHEMNPPSLDAARQGTDATVCEEPDDDGFIEDNYIQASEKERAERAAEELDDEGEVIDVHFSIG
ncbi:leucine-rich repeat transmembrane neuronal protein 4-like, partial [Scleropages formosus]